MQDIFPLIFGAVFVYLLFFRKEGMGMGCCGSHGRHDDHGHEPDKDWHFNELTEDRKEDVIDLRKDQYTVTVLPAKEDKHPNPADRTSSQ